MPEMYFRVRWPDGTAERCYSPSLIIKDHFAVGQTYAVDDFVERSRIALRTASERVRAKYGAPCSRALRQLAYIEAAAKTFSHLPDAHVIVDAFQE